MSDLVSIVLPTYNRPEGLRKAIQGVLKQTHQLFEVLVINDSSEEIPVQEVINQFEDNRIYYLRNQRTKGANGARNTGILNAKGAYIAFLDDDDEWLPEKLAWQLDYLQSHPDYVGVFSAYHIDEGGRWKEKIQSVDTLELKDCLLNTISIGSSSSLLFRASIFDHAGLWDETLIRQQDKELLVRILSKGSIGHDTRIALKVNGHNDPHPLKSIPGHEVYYEKMIPYVTLLEADAQKKFHSFHYRRLCMYYLRLTEYKKAFSLYRKAIKFQKIHLRKDTKNLIFLIKSIFSNKTPSSI